MAGRRADADRIWKDGLVAFAVALKDEPDGSYLRDELGTLEIEVADQMYQLGLAEEAGEILQQVILRTPNSLVSADGHHWRDHAMLRVLVGDLDGFRGICAEYFKRFRNNENYNLYRGCIAGPAALPPEDLKQLVAVAEKDRERHPKDDWYVLFAAMTQERSGEHAKALATFDQTRPGNSPAIPFGAARAIVMHNLGRDDEARLALTEEDGSLEKVYREALAGDFPKPIPSFDQIVLRELFRREAHSLIDAKPARDDPYRLLLRGRALAKMGRKKDSETAVSAALALRPGDPSLVEIHSRIMSELNRGDEQ
jgi:hypothetical protein